MGLGVVLQGLCLQVSVVESVWVCFPWGCQICLGKREVLQGVCLQACVVAGARTRVCMYVCVCLGYVSVG